MSMQKRAKRMAQIKTKLYTLPKQWAKYRTSCRKVTR
ncbi:MAG: hypothetical protein E7423_02355 [Ruminococcaceae bacterium]|nr:hypothetical protein [Oscillospiraceae bacterium]